jgi:hypothetical protein
MNDALLDIINKIEFFLILSIVFTLLIFNLNFNSIGALGNFTRIYYNFQQKSNGLILLLNGIGNILNNQCVNIFNYNFCFLSYPSLSSTDFISYIAYAITFIVNLFYKIFLFILLIINLIISIIDFTIFIFFTILPNTLLGFNINDVFSNIIALISLFLGISLIIIFFIWVLKYIRGLNT